MADPNFRREPIRSKKLRNAARGQRCTLNFPGICNYDADTVVLAHLHDETFGKGQKADDTSGVHACYACHTALDQHTHGLDGERLYKTLLRALQRTIRRVVLMGVVELTIDPPAKPRGIRPKADRKPSRPIPTRQNGWPEGRKIQSRNDLRKSEAQP